MSAGRLVWTRDGRLGVDFGVDTVHVAGCAHTRLARDVVPLDATGADAAQAEIAASMGWDNWPSEHDAAFDIRVAPCVPTGVAE